MSIEAVIAEALDQVRELQSIGAELSAIEHAYGRRADVDKARRRYRRLVDQLLAQVRDLLPADWCVERIHCCATT